MSFDTDPYFDATLAGEDVDTFAWFCLNKGDLLTMAPQREASEKLATDGAWPFNELDDEQTVDLRWVITGNVSPTGTPYSDAASGLAQNKRLFAARYFRVTRDAFGTVACAVTDVDGTGYEGRVKTRRPQFSEGVFECGVVMSVNIPRGELTRVAGS